MAPLAGHSLFLSSIDTGQLEGYLKDGVVILPGGHTTQLLLFLYLPNRNITLSENLDLKNPHLVASITEVPISSKRHYSTRNKVKRLGTSLRTYLLCVPCKHIAHSCFVELFCLK